MAPPWLHADPNFAGMVEMVPGIPPATRIGALALSGRSTTELAFLAGRHVAYHRAEHFMRLLVPQMRDLEDIFLAALSIGNPGLPLSAQVKELVVPIAKAIEPILEPVTVDHLRGYFLRFLEEGGRTNLQRWAAAVDRTAARAGLLLANDLGAARAVLELEDPGGAEGRMDDLLVFVLSDRFAKLRRQIGTALP
jgi:HAMP domain-containing protein